MGRSQLWALRFAARIQTERARAKLKGKRRREIEGFHFSPGSGHDDRRGIRGGVRGGEVSENDGKAGAEGGGVGAGC